MQILPAKWKTEAVFWERQNTAATNSAHIQRFSLSCNWNNYHSGGRDTAQQVIIPYPTAFPYGNGMVLHFYQQQESSTTKNVHKVINTGLKTYV